MLTMTDLFCGAGGSSTGALGVPGVQVRMASNHWPLAIETHNSNHPNTDHLCADLSQISPRYFPRTDILWASPECTNHSVARGRKRADSTPDLFGDVLPDEAAERSRATMWDVPRFAEHHRYRAVIVENVVDAYHWEPFRAWLMAMDCLGYQHRLVFMNSMHAQAHGLPAPQSRDRMYVVFWRKGDRAPDLDAHTRPRAVCPEHGEIQAIQSWKRPEKPWGRYRAQYVWRCPRVECRNAVVEPGWLPAAAAIDWTLQGKRIGDREKPLAPKTMARIRAGLERYGPHLTVHRFEYRTAPLTDPAPTLTASGNMLGLVIPVEGRDGKDARLASDPLRTMTTRSETGIVVTLRGQNAPKTTGDPLDTFAANGNHHGLVIPYRSQSRATSDREPLPTLTTVDPAAHVVTAKDVDDCLFRMLEPSEIKRGMAFPAEYRMLGNRREQVRLAGNAVCPPNARDLVAAVAESLS